MPVTQQQGAKRIVKVKIVRGVYWNGVFHERDSIMEIDSQNGAALMASGKAVAYVEPPAEKAPEQSKHKRTQD